ncbi:MAG: DUF1595 domain-containing protein, partial [Myxococcota bacterium]
MWGLGALIALAACSGDIGNAGGDAAGAGDRPAGLPPVDDPNTFVPDALAARLTDTQYAFTVEDIFGLALTDEERSTLPPDYPLEAHYSTSVERQVFNGQYVIAYAEVARSLTARLDPAQLRTDFGQCSDAEAACRDAFINGLGLRLFRRPLSPEEVTSFAALADGVAAFDEGTADDGIISVVQAMLQSPAFLYRLEDEVAGTADDIRFVNGYELASRMSYFLWQSAPDPA